LKGLSVWSDRQLVRGGVTREKKIVGGRIDEETALMK